jgi:hypothetical protein
MDCREFRERHAPFVDLMCSAHDENEMREHLRSCSECTRHDTRVRRSLMLVRSLPTIELSPDFRARLDAKLRAVALEPALSAPKPMRFSARSFASIAAGVAFVTYLATDLVRQSAPPEVTMAPVVATLPQTEPMQVATPAMVAAVPTGMSVWPAIMLASQAQIQFVAAELANER